MPPEGTTAAAPTTTASPAQPASAPLTQAGSSPVSSADKGNPAADPATPVQAKPAATAPEMFELKFNGKKIKLSREELMQHASLGLASDERFREGANLKKQAESVIGKLKNPKGVIAALQDPALGLTKDQIKVAFEEWYAQEYIDPETLKPEEIELRKAKERLKKYEDDDKAREEEKRKAHDDSLTAQARQEIQNQIIEALDSGKLPRTNFAMKRLAHWIERNNENNFNAPTDVLVAQVRKDIDTNLRELVQAADADVLVQLMGDEIIQKVRKYDLEKLKAARERRSASPVNAAPTTDAPKEQKRGEPIDVNARLRELQRTGRY